MWSLLVGIGTAAFLQPFWMPASALPDQAHATDAPLVAGLVGAVAVFAVLVEVRRGTMNGATVAMLGVLGATTGLLRLLDLPAGGNAMFWVVLLVGAAFGARFGFLLGMVGMVVGAALTGGFGPWLPFQMLASGGLGALAGGAGRASRSLPRVVQIGVLVAVGWIGAFAYGAVMDLWFWPYAISGGPLSWRPGLGLGGTLRHFWRFYVATSLAWDAAGAFANAVAVAVLGPPVLATLRRFADRLDPVVEIVPDPS
ncbi:MAG: ECF transporter S component [Actinobacteria bacterium]|nr:ECF transporter S component [Actinomycetota bacterium]